MSDIVAAAEAIEEYVEGLSRDEFVGLDIVRRAVRRRLTEIGEAASRLSPEFRTRHADIPWADIIGFRSIAVHAYVAVDWRIVRFAAARNAPDLAIANGRPAPAGRRQPEVALRQRVDRGGLSA